MIRSGSSKFKMPFLLSFAAFIILASISVLATWYVEAANKEIRTTRMMEQADRLAEHASNLIELYQYGLRGARGYVLASGDSLSRAGFQQYMQTRDVAVEFPGAGGFGFIRRVPVDQEIAFLEKARMDDYPSFAMRQLNKHDAERYVIQYIEPVDRNLAAVGLDIGSETDRRSAADDAILTGMTQLTAPITLVQATGNPQQSFLILMAVYSNWHTPDTEQARWRVAIGWTYAPLLMTEILERLNVDPEMFDLRLTDVGDPENPQVFHEKISNNQLSLFPQTRLRDVQGRKWQLELGASSAFVASLHLLNPSLVLTYGLLISLLLSFLFFTVGLNARNRAQLVNQQAKFATILESSRDAIISADLNGNILTWNQGAEAIFGYSKENALNRDLFDLIVLDVVKDVAMNIYADVLAGQSYGNLITTPKRKDGRAFDAQINIVPIRNTENSVMSVSITLHDISALTQAERALQDMNAKLEIRVSERTQELSKAHRDSKAIFETINAQFLYSEADLQSNIIYVNDNLCTATGFNREELIGQNHNILNSGIHPKEFWSEMWEQLSHGKSWRAEICNRSRNGKLHWYDSVMAPVMNEEGQIERIVSLRSDITERVQIGRQLKIIGDQLSVAINVAKLGVWTWDLSTDRLKWNDRMYEIYDQPKELGAAGLKYHHWRDRVHSEDVEATEASLIGAVEGREEFTPTFRIYSPSRGLRYVLAGAQVVRDSQGKALKVTGINFDVTDQVMLEFELRGAKKEADVASELKSQFLANMSHEIRTPMNGVIGMTDLLLGTELNEIQHNYAKTVKSSADSLLAIINDILDFSKVEKGMLDLNAVEFDLGEMLHEIGRNMSFRAYDKGLELICPANYMPQQWVNADLGRIRQILNNLLGNALKFTKQGEVALYCTVQEQTTLHTKILIEVTDTGIGLSEEQQSKLFQRFSQADGSTTRKFGGTGLGLSISKQLVELMGGEIGVKSTEGKGSTFWFTLDLANAKALAPLPSMDDLTGQKVLVVDDNLTSRTLLLQLLTNWQMEHALVDSGEAALVRLTAAAAEGKPFSIAIVDMQMPEMDGAQLGAVIKNDSALADTHLVMLISQEASGDAKKLKEAGFDGYLNKPVVETVLYNALRQVAVITANEQPLITVYTSSELPKFNARVLVVVEDNITNQIVAQCMLEEFGIQVDLAANGEEALTALETLPYDIVFMDCQMPVMDGYEATRSIREPTFNFHASREHDRAIPIIAVTANTMQGDREKCFAAGMDDFIAKPVELEKLQQALQRWLPEPEAEKAPQIVDTNFNKASN